MTPTQSQTELITCPSCGRKVGVVRAQGREPVLQRHNMRKIFGYAIECPGTSRPLAKVVKQ